MAGDPAPSQRTHTVTREGNKMQHEAPPPPPISLDDPACVTIDEAARLEIIRTGHGAPATRNTLRRWIENGVGGIRIPTKT